MRGAGLAAALLSAVCAGSIESNKGSAMVTPIPRRNVRRGRCFFVRNIAAANLSQLTGGEQAAGRELQAPAVAGAIVFVAALAGFVEIVVERLQAFQILGLGKLEGFIPDVQQQLRVLHPAILVL